jgi:citrate synthase
MSDPSEILMQITRGHLDTGLRGYPVGTVRTSRVDPWTGVSYVGYSMGDLAFKDPEAVVYLLFNKRLPTAEELKEFKNDLAQRSELPFGMYEMLKGLPKEGHPMEWLCMGIFYLGMIGKTGRWLDDALNLVARSPALIAAIFRIRSEWGEPIPPDPSLGLAENFVHMLGIPGGNDEKVTELLRSFYILHMDHGGGNLSTFVGKSVASGLADIYSSMAGAMAGLYGPRHGRANQAGLNFVRKVGSSDPAIIEKFIRAELDAGGLIYGFGHAVLRAEDPRATIQYLIGERICPDDPLFRTAANMRKVAVKVLKENPKVANPYPNVDAVSGSLLNAVGLTDSDYYTVLFGWARIVGIAAQIVDERVNLRGGKGVPIYRSKFVAEGQTPHS